MDYFGEKGSMLQLSNASMVNLQPSHISAVRVIIITGDNVNTRLAHTEYKLTSLAVKLYTTTVVVVREFDYAMINIILLYNRHLRLKQIHVRDLFFNFTCF